RIARFVPVMVPSVGHRAVATRARALGPERLVDLSLAMSLHDPSRLDPVLRRRLIHLAAERFAYPEAPQAYADAARTLLRELTDGADADLGVAATERPTLLVHGARDRLVAIELARAAAERHAHLQLHVLDELGHAPQLEDPSVFLDVTTSWLDTALVAPAT
ncbi:MAG TPA: alpha/beta hydrolase, partial [Gaiellaceae bacterium]|nr:alpha/beta hydrolase [Gaiellaceae bacterium]